MGGRGAPLNDVPDRLAAEFEAVPEDAWDAGALRDDLAALLDAVFLDSVPRRPPDPAPSGTPRLDRLDRLDQHLSHPALLLTAISSGTDRPSG